LNHILNLQDRDMLTARLLQLPTASQQHRHEHHQVVIGVRGEADLNVEGSGAHLDSWRACLVPTEARHDFSGTTLNHVLVINLDPWAPARHSPGYGDYQRFVPLFDKPRTLELDSHLQRLVQFSAGEFRRAPDNDHLKNHLAASLLHCLAGRLPGMQAAGPKRFWAGPETIRRHILENLGRKIPVEELAGVACLSVSRFHEVFRETTGQTPHQFLIDTRLDQTIKLLATTTLPVAEISQRAGFSSQSALTNALKKYRGITPGRVREDGGSRD
jgi:AraC-like DNA-binding protein